MKDSEDKARSPDDIVKDLGGCGRYQLRLSVTIHLIKTIFTFSFTNLIVITSIPVWWCQNNSFENASHVEYSTQTCLSNDTIKCKSFSFDGNINTIVSEFKLVCEHDFIPSTINSLQLAGTVTGNVISGHFADRFGRKPPFLIAIPLVCVCNLVGFFSTSWEMFAVSTFFAGLGHGCFTTTQFNIMSEYTPAKWRAFIIGFPSQALQQCLLAFLAWLIRDWRYLLLMTSLMAVPCFFASYFIVPESFRFYLAQNKPEKARDVITSIAEFNRHYAFNTEVTLKKPESRDKNRYSFLNLFQTRALIKVTLLSMLNWMALGIVGFGMSFGIQTLSGDLFLNLFLFSLTSIPSRAMAMWLSNRIGRRKTACICFIIVGTAGLTGGILQTTDARYKDPLTNVLAMIANTSISAAWGTVQTMTVELYPTVIRNIGFGMLSFIGGMGSVISPQLVYLNTYVSGLLLYVCGAISVLCVIGTLLLPETKDKNLLDKIMKVKTVVNDITNLQENKNDEAACANGHI